MGRQKRSANTYQKINTIFLRDTKNIIMQYDGFTEPEFEYLRGLKWRAEEKIDGTNCRIEASAEIVYNKEYENNVELVETDEVIGVKFNVRYTGKTDNAQIPPKLDIVFKSKYTPDKVYKALGIKEYIPVEEFAEHKWVDDNGKPDVSKVPSLYTIYGEGYGVGIQKGGNYIKDHCDFIVFDVKVNNIWLKTEARDEIAAKLGAPVVPYIGDFTIDEAIEYVRKGFKSTIAENKDYMAEGLVLRTPCGLLNRMGKRLITKIKYEDFEKYRKVYGTDDPVPQEKNPFL